MWGPTQNLGPIGFAILRFIGYIRSDKQTDPDKQSIYIGLILKNDGFTNFKQKNNNNVDIDDNNNINTGIVCKNDCPLSEAYWGSTKIRLGISSQTS